MNVYLSTADDRLGYKLQTLVIGLGYPLLDIVNRQEFAKAVVTDNPEQILDYLEKGHYLALYVSQAQARRIPSIPAEHKPRYRVFVIKPKHLRDDGESPALGKLIAYLLRLSEQLKIT